MKQGGFLKILFLFLFISFLEISCVQGGGCGGLFQQGKGGVPVMAEQVKVIETSPITVVEGALVPNDKADISYLNDVKIQEVYVNKGDFVSTGDPLFRLSEDEMNNELAYLKTRQTELENLIEKNNNILRSRETLLDEGKVDRDEIQRLEKEISLNESELERVKAESKKLQYNLENLLVTSPISGVVTIKNINAGSAARAGENLISVVDISPIIVSFPISAKQSENISIEMPMKIIVNEVPGKTYTAKVTYISPELHRVGKTFEVWAAIPNDDFVLKSGMSASTEFVSDTTDQTYIVPLSAVLSRTSRPFVYKVTKGTAHRTPVNIGSITDDKVEIVRGVEEGDIVVTRGGEDLFDGAEVSIWR